MRLIRKCSAVVLSLVLILSLAACGSTPTSNGSGNAGTSTKTFTLGMDSPKGTVTYFYAEAFAKEVETRSNGAMTVELYPDGTLGGDVALLESCHGGNVTFVIQTTAPQVNFIPELAVFDMPMVYPTIEEFRTALDNPELMSKISGYYDAAGYKLMGYADQTFRVMSSNKKIEGFGDFSGVKIRTMENPFHMDFWKAVGATPTPMAFGELYTGLQQGTVVAQENPYAVIAANKLYEVQKFIIQSNHLPHTLSLIMNPGEFNALSAEDQKILEEATAAAVKAARAEASSFEAEKIKEIEAAGTEIVPVSDELYKQMKEAAQPVYDAIAAKVGQELVDLYLGQ